MPGISCHQCFDKLTKQQMQRFEEQEKQIQLAKQRGQSHIGSDALSQIEENRLKKQTRKKQQLDN